jgi:CRP-like cAMP-binding protein
MAVEDSLAQIELFAELPKTDLARLASTTVVRNFKKGDVIVREGEIGVAFYLISKGGVEVVKGLGTSQEQLLATLSAGNFFGEMALFDNQVRSASVRAANDCECLVLTKWDFNAELTGNGCRIAIALLAALARRIRAMQEAHTH